MQYKLMLNIRERRVTAEMRRSTVPLEAFTSGEQLIVTCPYGVFEVGHGYPFKPPKLLIFGEDHIRILYRRQTSLKEFLKCYNLNLKCACCKNLRCSWSPCYGLQEVMDEYVDFSRRINIFSRLKVALSNLPFDDNVNSHIISFFV